MPRSLPLAALAAIAVLTLGFVWLDRRAEAAASLLRPDDAQLVARGESIYRAHCAACHGARLQGQPNWRERGPDGLLPAPPHDATGHTWHHPDEMLVRITRLGVARAANLPGYASAMPPYAGVLSDEEIVAVLSWIKAQWPADVRRRHDEINRAWAEQARAGS